MTRLRSTGTREASRSGLSEDPVIIPDANLNALIVLAEQKTHELVADALIKLADDRLYAAKESGRDRIFMESGVQEYTS